MYLWKPLSDDVKHMVSRLQFALADSFSQCVLAQLSELYLTVRQRVFLMLKRETAWLMAEDHPNGNGEPPIKKAKQKKGWKPNEHWHECASLCISMMMVVSVSYHSKWRYGVQMNCTYFFCFTASASCLLPNVVIAESLFSVIPCPLPAPSMSHVPVCFCLPFSAFVLMLFLNTFCTSEVCFYFFRFSFFFFFQTFFASVCSPFFKR